AGITVTHRLDDLDEASAREGVEVNQLGSLWGAAEAVCAYVASGAPGVVVSISSVHAIRAAQHYPVYEMTKAAVDALTRSVAVSYGPHGIRAVAIAPGAIMTPALRTSLETEQDRAATAGVLERVSALGRIGRPEDIAGAVAFALSEEASFLTGTTICVDGGWTSALLPGHREPADGTG
ncbi:MAG: SDR family oxidoreductase, partial [Microthrixaceae bacterium]|nr:SDR family oxidoreductase [Microthrixaceae bacterium]